MSIDAEPILELRDVCAGYGRKKVLHGVSLNVPRGAVVSLLGHNGAGKSTTLRTAVGAVRCTSGHILLEGQDISTMSIPNRLRRGVAYVEPRGILPGLAVRDNLDVATHILPAGRRRGDKLDEVLTLFPALKDRLGDNAGMLSGGQRQQLALGMALMVSPRILMLDEPLLGLSPPLAQAVMRAVRTVVTQADMAVLLVEQNVRLALEASSWTYVMRAGEITRTSPSVEILDQQDFWSII
jgi:ABC-type branched-subunit amino acid transport system ATPase component